jgi:uncharacterized surface protein with fasciclin (FAS1) repeats
VTPEFTTLPAAVDVAALAQTLDGPGSSTVFPPTMVTATHIEASNGVVRVIDAFLIPPP